jgi:hypothetical protein
LRTLSRTPSRGPLVLSADQPAVVHARCPERTLTAPFITLITLHVVSLHLDQGRVYTSRCQAPPGLQTLRLLGGHACKHSCNMILKSSYYCQLCVSLRSQLWYVNAGRVSRGASAAPSTKATQPKSTHNCWPAQCEATSATQTPLRVHPLAIHCSPPPHLAPIMPSALVWCGTW